MFTDEDRQRYRGLARNLAAAMMTYRMGLKSMDYVAKHYLDRTEGDLGDFWFLMARVVSEAQADEDFTARIIAALRPASDDVH